MHGIARWDAGGASLLCFVRHSTSGLIEEFSDEPEVAKGVNDRALEHAADGAGAQGFVFVFGNGTD